MTAPCEYCSFYIDSKQRIFLDDKDKVKSRWCNMMGKFVKSTGSCERFSLNRFQWCKKEVRWIVLEVCSYKRMTDQNSCKNCRQGKTLSELRKAQSFRNREKPILVSRRKE